MNGHTPILDFELPPDAVIVELVLVKTATGRLAPRLKVPPPPKPDPVEELNPWIL